MKIKPGRSYGPPGFLFVDMLPLFCMEKKKRNMLLGATVLVVLMVIVYVVTRPLPELKVPVQQELSIPESVSNEGVFSITNLRSDKQVYALSDGQEFDSGVPEPTINFTWGTTGDLSLLTNPLLVFAMVDEEDTVVIDYLYGSYNDVPLEYGAGTIGVPVLCSVLPTEACMFGDDFDPDLQYRVQASVIDCTAAGDNPFICSRGEQETISVAYSNWFQLRE